MPTEPRTASPRPRPFAPPPQTPETDELLRASRFYRPGQPLKVFDALLHHPHAMRSLRGFLNWGPDSTLTSREREILILRCIARTHCIQEWSVHSVTAIELGLVTPDELSYLSGASTPPADWAGRDEHLVKLVDATCRNNTLDDVEWTAARTAFTAPELIEALIVIGFYRMVNGLQNALAVPAETDLNESTVRTVNFNERTR